MKILIATPCYGGQLTADYFRAALATRDLLHSHRVQHAFYTLSNESLIPRARNKCAQFALEHKFTHLIFIDADIVWDPQWVLELIVSEHAVVGGTYPIKKLPLFWNFNPLPGSPREIPENGTVEVMHLPTGFLRIDCKVFEKLQTHVPQYESYEPATGTLKTYYDFFPSGEHLGKYESEDWGFCRLAREAGYSVMLEAKMRCRHIGTYIYGE